MGLDTTHDCWHGPYSYFNAFRAQIAKVVHIDLHAMYGFGGDVPWSSIRDEPLVILLNHSDCDGEISPADAAALARRLREIIPLIPDHPDDVRGDAIKFATGCEAAAASNEYVEFR